MEKRKLVLAHCEKTGKHFCLELRQVGRGWKVINFIDLTENDVEKIPAEAPENVLETAISLLECEKCGGRRVSGCCCATVGKSCAATDRYDFQCIYCSELKLDNNGEAPVIMVSSPNYDNIGQVLDTMSLSREQYNGGYDCDLLFINCGTGDNFDNARLREFVERGGCLYLSDLAFSFLVGAFPGILDFEASGEACRLTAEVMDEELRGVIGDRTEIEFDLNSWAIINGTPGLAAHDGRVLLRAASKGKYSGKPIMVTFKYGKGNVFYTSFHNYAQASEKERMLLQLLLMKQIGAKSNKTLEQVGELIGLNIAIMKEKFDE